MALARADGKEMADDKEEENGDQHKQNHNSYG